MSSEFGMRWSEVLRNAASLRTRIFAPGLQCRTDAGGVPGAVAINRALTAQHPVRISRHTAAAQDEPFP
jgi:hypothetical protein